MCYAPFLTGKIIKTCCLGRKHSLGFVTDFFAVKRTEILRDV